MEQFTGGELLVGVADIPYKCPPAPLEFVLMVSAAHFEAKVLSHRIAHRVNPTKHAADACYDGKVLCFLETGHGKASQIAFDFDHPPAPHAPNTFYHYEKLLFNKVYWYIVPKGIV